MKLAALFWMSIGLGLTMAPADAPADPVGHITGVGGVFVKSKDPKALAQWYKEVLGLDVKPWGGAAMPSDLPGHPPKVSWTAFPKLAIT